MTNLRSSSHTGRTPRTMKSAFGHHTNHYLHPMREPRRRMWQDVALYIVALLAVLVVVHFAN